MTDPTASPRNFGWPCWEGDATFPAFQALGTSICAGLSAGEVTKPYYQYHHGVDVASGDGCGTANGGSISGVTFLPPSTTYPGAYDGALFFADYVRRCIWYLPGGAGGLPTAGPAKLFANLDRIDAGASDGGAVFLTTDPNGEVLYVDYDRGEIRRIHYYGLANPPVAKFTRTPSSGPAPLQVSFDASASTSSHGQLTYAWDLNGDGQFDDATGVTAQRTYPTVGQVTVGLKVTDPAKLTGATTHVISVDESPPTVTIDLPDPDLHWKVGDTIDFSGSATDLQDGTLPASAFTWTVTMRHCPSACHSHIIETESGVASGSFVAPDHEVPSHIQLSVTVTDSAGLTGSASIDLDPLTGTVTTKSSPAGIATTAGVDTDLTASATAIVKSSASVSAPATSFIGEDIWSFESWSDGGARTHQVPVVNGTTALTATYTRTGTVDASDTCSGAAPPVDPTGRWQAATFGAPDDVDWYRFKLTATKRVRIVLGDLTVPGKLELFQGCSKLLKVSDRGGLGAEEIVRKLVAGNYAIRLSGGGSPSTGQHVFLIKKLPAAVRVLTSNALISGGTLRLVGEVYNNTSRTVGPVTVTARLYDATGKLLATRSHHVDLKFVKPLTRAPFSIVGSLPAGFDHVSWSVSAPKTSKRIVRPASTIASAAADAAGHWVVTGTIRNTKSYTVRHMRFAVTLYDSRGNVLDVVRAHVDRRTLGPGASTTFVATFGSTGITPDRIYRRAMAVH